MPEDVLDDGDRHSSREKLNGARAVQGMWLSHSSGHFGLFALLVEHTPKCDGGHLKYFFFHRGGVPPEGGDRRYGD